MNKLVLLGAMLISCLNLPAQNQSSIIKGQAMDMARALLKKDYDAFSRYIHPNLIEAAGGKKQLEERMDTANTFAAQFGAEIKKIIIGNPAKVISYHNQLQTTLPQFTQLTSSFGDAELETTLIAISTDNGKNWKFVDTSVFKLKDVKRYLPDLSPDLGIPAPKPPKFIPK